MEDYEKKYKEALSRAATELETCGTDKSLRNMIYAIFPDELKESEDEKIRNALIRFHKSTIDIDGIKGADIIAWLEKQVPVEHFELKKGHWYMCHRAYCSRADHLTVKEGERFQCEKDGIVNGFAIKDPEKYFIEVHAPAPMEDDQNDEVRRRSTIQVLEYAKSLDAYNQYGKEDIDKDIAWLEKQGEQKSILDFKASNWYVSKVDGKIHDITYNSTNKIEPKFKVGDWVVTDKNDRVQIKAVNNDYYTIDNGMYFNIPYIDRYCHLWTIQDARDGDVLHSIGFHNDCIFIFNGLDNDGYREVATGYCCIFVSADKIEFGIQGPDGIEIDTVKPATQIQRDLLFQNMKESGYEWDDEKKELKKIEQKYTVKPIFSIGDVLCDKSCTTLDKNSQPNIEVRDIRNDMYICNNCSFPISQQDEYELVAKRIEPQSAWSDEDEGMKENIEGALDCYESMVSEDWEKEKEWLTSIKDRMQPQIKGWSEEDERMYRMCVDAVEYYHTPEDESVIREWLKSLKERITWKPSKKQMETLEYYMHTLLATEHKEVLFGLYNDLKKL